METTFKDRFGIYPLDWSENETCETEFVFVYENFDDAVSKLKMELYDLY